MTHDFVFWSKIFICALASYRIARDIATQPGPFDLFFKLRDWAVRKYKVGHWIPESLECPICVSWIVSAALTPVMFNVNSFSDFVVISASVSCIALIMHIKMLQWL